MAASDELRDEAIAQMLGDTHKLQAAFKGLRSDVESLRRGVEISPITPKHKWLMGLCLIVSFALGFVACYLWLGTSADLGAMIVERLKGMDAQSIGELLK